MLSEHVVCPVDLEKVYNELHILLPDASAPGIGMTADSSAFTVTDSQLDLSHDVLGRLPSGGSQAFRSMLFQYFDWTSATW